MTGKTERHAQRRYLPYRTYEPTRCVTGSGSPCWGTAACAAASFTAGTSPSTRRADCFAHNALVRKKEDTNHRPMTLFELSKEYEAGAAALHKRLDELRALFSASNVCQRERDLLEARIRTLQSMYTDMRQLAVLTRRYYERGYYRNARYTL